MKDILQVLRAIEIEDKREDIILKLKFVIEEINFLLLRIRFSVSFQNAMLYFDLLERVHLSLAKIQHKLGINLPVSLLQFVKDFDSLHDLAIREHLFNNIKNDKYLYSPNYELMIIKYQNEIDDFVLYSDLNAQVSFLNEQLKRLLAKIKLCKTFNEANQYFDFLENIHHCLAILSFKYDVLLSKDLNAFVRDFDRMDDFNERERLFEMLKENKELLYL